MLMNVHSFAQENINSTTFFNKVQSSSILATQSQSDITFKPTLFEDLDLRTETRDFDFDQQEYQFRFDLSTKAKRNAQSDLFDIYKSRLSLSNNNNSKLLEEAYKDWIDLYFIFEMEKSLKEMKLIVDDKISVLEIKTQSLDLKLKDLLNQKSISNNITITLLDLDYSKQQLLSKYNLQGLTPTFDDIIDIKEIIELLFLKKIQKNQLLEDEFNLKSEIINREIALEVAEGKEYFDFGQIRYRGPHEDGIQERISIAAAVNLNRSGNRALKIAKLKMEKDELESEYQLDVQEEYIEAQEVINSIVKQSEILETFIKLKEAEVSEAENLSNQLLKNQTVNPLLLLDIKENKISIEMEKLEREKDIYESYIDYLIKTNALSTPTPRNYLKA